MIRHKRKTNKEFIEDAINKHGDVYEYFKVNYISNRKHIIVVCKIHEDFLITPKNHLKGSGCPLCLKIKLDSIKIKSFEFVLNKMQTIHNNIYDYSKSKYINETTPIIIICNKHGEFIKTPTKHYKYGCGKCGH